MNYKNNFIYNMQRIQNFSEVFIIKKGTIFIFLFLLLYRFILDFSYCLVIYFVWSYAKFGLNLNYFKLIESYLLLFVILFLIPKTKEKLSNIIVGLLILLSYIPTLTLFAFVDQPRLYMYAITGFWILVFLFLKIPIFSFVPLKHSQARILKYVIFFGLSAIVFFQIYKYLGFSLNFNLIKVYEIRKKYIQANIPFSGYLFNWVGHIISPVFFAIFFTQRKWFLLGLVLFLQILLFSITGLKNFLFILLFVPVLIWVANRKDPIIWVAIGLIILILLGMLAYFLINDLWVLSLFTRRTLLVPAQLSFFYYDFFSKSGPIFLSQHRLFRNFLDYPYELLPSHLIGKVYFNSPEMGANNGIYADAYMNFGFLGFILWAFLLATILRLVDSLSKDKEAAITFVAIFMPILSIINSALFTTLLTHGLLLSLLLLYLLPKEYKKI